MPPPSPLRRLSDLSRRGSRRGLFGDHVDGAGDKEARDARKHRGVDHPQPLGAVHAEVAAQHAAAGARSDRAGAGRVVAPGAAAHEVLELVVALQCLARLLLGGDRTLGGQLRGQPADKADAGDHRGEVFPGRVAALLEIAEIDQRRVARIGRAQANLASAVLCVRLEDRPGQIIGLGRFERE